MSHSRRDHRHSGKNLMVTIIAMAGAVGTASLFDSYLSFGEIFLTCDHLTNLRAKNTSLSSHQVSSLESSSSSSSSSTTTTPKSSLSLLDHVTHSLSNYLLELSSENQNERNERQNQQIPKIDTQLEKARLHNLHSQSTEFASTDVNKTSQEQHNQIQKYQLLGHKQQHRRLFTSLIKYMDPKSVTPRTPDILINENNYDFLPDNATNNNIRTSEKQLLVPPSRPNVNQPSDNQPDDIKLPNVAPYNIKNILLTLPTFYRELFLLYYDPHEDEFFVYIDETKDQFDMPVRNRLNTIMPMLTFAFRNHFPERFHGGEGRNSRKVNDFITLVSSGDEPKLICDCVDKFKRFQHIDLCQNEFFAPILQFGSIYVDKDILPSVVTMPVWHHIPCFREWQQSENVCESWRRMAVGAGVLGGAEAVQSKEAEEMASKVGSSTASSTTNWDRLVPQLVWRGTDFGFLHCIYRRVHSADFDKDVAPNISRFGNHARGVVLSLLESWDFLTPRWKGAALTALAELDTVQLEETKHNHGVNFVKGEDIVHPQRILPWIDAKFTEKSTFFGKPVDPNKKSRYAPFREYGIQPTGERLSLSQLSHYKYHIDFGGGGGTTW